MTEALPHEQLYSLPLVFAWRHKRSVHMTKLGYASLDTVTRNRL